MGACQDQERQFFSDAGLLLLYESVIKQNRELVFFLTPKVIGIHCLYEQKTLASLWVALLPIYSRYRLANTEINLLPFEGHWALIFRPHMHNNMYCMEC